MNAPTSALNQSLATLRRFAQRRESAERCELCSAPLAAEHTHLIEPRSRQISCSCDGCALLFSGSTMTKYRRIPRRVRCLSDFRLSDAQWDSLLVPINMAFFFHSSPEQRVVAMYPSPAGATESLLDLQAWGDIVADNPILAKMEADVEALLVNRVRRGGEGGMQTSEYYLTPIDECYKLVGLIRTNWRGLSGGKEVWSEIARFFEALKARCG